MLLLPTWILVCDEPSVHISESRNAIMRRRNALQNTAPIAERGTRQQTGRLNKVQLGCFKKTFTARDINVRGIRGHQFREILVSPCHSMVGSRVLHRKFQFHMF